MVLSPLRGLQSICAIFPGLAPWANFLRSLRELGAARVMLSRVPPPRRTRDQGHPAQVNSRPDTKRKATAGPSTSAVRHGEQPSLRMTVVWVRSCYPRSLRHGGRGTWATPICAGGDARTTAGLETGATRGPTEGACCGGSGLHQISCAGCLPARRRRHRRPSTARPGSGR